MRTFSLTKFLGFPHFCRATAADLTSLLQEMMNMTFLGISFFFVSSNGPKINRAVWKNLNQKLKEKGHEGLVALIVCTLHAMHNAFRKGSSVGGFGEIAAQLAFDLHAWFKVYFSF